jgi:hypothetical protein
VERDFRCLIAEEELLDFSGGGEDYGSMDRNLSMTDACSGEARESECAKCDSRMELPK